MCFFERLAKVIEQECGLQPGHQCAETQAALTPPDACCTAEPLAFSVSTEVAS